MFKQIVRNPYIYIILISYYCVWLVWDAIKLPYHNPADIISALPQIEYNPSNNIVRFLIAILFPPLMCLIAWSIINKKPAKLWALINRLRFPRIALTAAIVAASILLSIGMGILQASTNPANTPADTYGGPYSHALIDTFHEGETLGPAISNQQADLAPYRDFVIVHGVFQDVLRTNIAFNLFGESIGASRAFASILTIIGFILYYVLLLVLFRGNVYKSALGLCIVSLLMLPSTAIPFVGTDIFGVNLPFRDIATILFFIVAILGLRFIDSNNKKGIILTSGIIGFIALAGFANSIDRALYIAVLSILWLVLVWILSAPKQFFKTVFLPYAIGILVGIPVLGTALKWAFGDFFDYLLTMSKYKEYLDGIIFTKPDSAVTIVLLIVAAVITIFGAVALKTLNTSVKGDAGLAARFKQFIQRIKPIVQQYAIVILLFAAGLFFLRSAIGRAVPDHWIYSVQWLYLALAYVGINYLFTIFKKKQKILGLMIVVLLGSCLVLYGLTVKKIDIRNDTFPIHVQDKDLMKTDYIETADYLKKNLKDDETFVTLTSEASWYYFVGKPSPIKYPVIWYAFTKPQREVIATQLSEGTNIKYALTNNNWTSNFDYVPNETRFPEVYSVLKEKYVPYIGIGQQTIWIRK